MQCRQMQEKNPKGVFCTYYVRQQSNVTLEKQKPRYLGTEMCPLSSPLTRNRTCYFCLFTTVHALRSSISFFIKSVRITVNIRIPANKSNIQIQFR